MLYELILINEIEQRAKIFFLSVETYYSLLCSETTLGYIHTLYIYIFFLL